MRSWRSGRPSTLDAESRRQSLPDPEATVPYFGSRSEAIPSYNGMSRPKNLPIVRYLEDEKLLTTSVVSAVPMTPRL